MFILLRQRVSTMFRVLSSKGTSGLIELIRAFLVYQVYEKWRFVYFEKCIEKVPFKLPKLEDSIIIREAVEDDIPQIKNDIYPFLTEKEGNDKRYIEKIGTTQVKCFLAERQSNPQVCADAMVLARQRLPLQPSRDWYPSQFNHNSTEHQLVMPQLESFTKYPHNTA